MKTAILLSLLLIGVVAPVSAEPTHTVSWYQQRPFDRTTTLQACRDNPGELGKTPNCVNAEKAEALGPLMSKHSVPFHKGTPPLQAQDFNIPAWRK